MIAFKNVNKWFGKLHVLNDINLEVAKGEVVVVCGPSGYARHASSKIIECSFRANSNSFNGYSIFDIVCVTIYFLMETTSSKRSSFFLFDGCGSS